MRVLIPPNLPKKSKNKALALPDEAALYWEKAAKSSDAEALFELAMRGLKGKDTIPVPISVAIDNLKSAANKKWPEALHVLGELYRGVVPVALAATSAASSGGTPVFLAGPTCSSTSTELAGVGGGVGPLHGEAENSGGGGHYYATSNIAPSSLGHHAAHSVGHHSVGPGLQNVLRRDCVKASRYLSLACDAILQQREQNESAAKTYESRLLTIMRDFDTGLSERLLLARVVQKWSGVGKRRKQLLGKLVHG